MNTDQFMSQLVTYKRLIPIEDSKTITPKSGHGLSQKVSTVRLVNGKKGLVKLLIRQWLYTGVPVIRESIK